VSRINGAARRSANAGQVSLGQRKIVSAIEHRRIGGSRIARREDCGHDYVAYDACCNRHCPRCQGAAAKQWLGEREAALQLVPPDHVVFALLASRR
jgi:hypothetical protein